MLDFDTEELTVDQEVKAFFQTPKRGDLMKKLWEVPEKELGISAEKPGMIGI